VHDAHAICELRILTAYGHIRDDEFVHEGLDKWHVDTSGGEHSHKAISRRSGLSIHPQKRKLDTNLIVDLNASTSVCQ
jgi:hypothetical protein